MTLEEGNRDQTVHTIKVITAALISSCTLEMLLQGDLKAS